MQFFPDPGISKHTIVVVVRLAYSPRQSSIVLSFDSWLSVSTMVVAAVETLSNRRIILAGIATWNRLIMGCFTWDFWQSALPFFFKISFPINLSQIEHEAGNFFVSGAAIARNGCLRSLRELLCPTPQQVVIRGEALCDIENELIGLLRQRKGFMLVLTGIITSEF